jgi:hypothetical protein
MAESTTCSFQPTIKFQDRKFLVPHKCVYECDDGVFLRIQPGVSNFVAFVLGMSLKEMKVHAQTSSTKLSIAGTYAFRTLIKARNDAQIVSMTTESESRLAELFDAGSSGNVEPTEGEDTSQRKQRLSTRKFGQAARGGQHGRTLHVEIGGATFECLKVKDKESPLFIKICSKDSVYVKTTPSDGLHAVLTFLANNINADDLKEKYNWAGAYTKAPCDDATGSNMPLAHDDDIDDNADMTDGDAECTT